MSETDKDKPMSLESGDINSWMDHVRKEARRLFAIQNRVTDKASNKIAWSTNETTHLEDVRKEVKDDNVSPAFNAHAHLLALEADFQTRLLRFQDDQTMDYSQISNLREPLDHLLDVYLSFESPTEIKSTPSHVEATLRILSLLLQEYDKTLTALQKARDTVGRMESNHVLQQQRTAEWGYTITRELHRVRQLIQRSQEREGYLETERDVLRKKVQMLEREKAQNETLILEMAKKVNEADEKTFKIQRETKKSNTAILSLKSQLSGIKKLKDHLIEFGVVSEPLSKPSFDPHLLRKKSSSSSLGRDRAQKYTDNVDFYKNRNGTVKVKKPIKKRVRPAEVPPREVFPKEGLGKLSPARENLLNRLRDVDDEINQLARELSLY